MNEEIDKNKRLEEENRKLKIENEKLKSELKEVNEVISVVQNNQIDTNEILRNELNIKNHEINALKLKIQNSVIVDEPKYAFNDIMVVTFISQDLSMNEGIKCLSTDTFAEVEEKLYKIYDNLRDTNNMFTANGKCVLRFRKLCENGIKDGDKIQFFNVE